MGSSTVSRMPMIEWGEPRGGEYSIAEVVRRSGVPSSSVHHYRRAGLIPEPRRTAPNRFVYDDRHIAALELVRSLRRRGVTLDDIRRALPDLVAAELDSIGDVLDAYTVACDATSSRARLIEAAIGAFAEQGYRDVSVDALCTRAGVAKGTFYRHFEGKDALFLIAAGAVIERAIAAFAADVEAGVGADHAAMFAQHLRRGLPVLLELAKRSIQDSGATVHAGAQLFFGLAERLGKVVGNDTDPAQAGGFVIVLAVVEIFNELLETELPDSV